MKFLCEKCANRRGKLRVYHRIDSQGIERSYTNIQRVCCKAGGHTTLKDAVQRTPYADARAACREYRPRRGVDE